LLCHLGQVDETVSVHVSAEVKTRQLVVDQAELDFGLIRYGDAATRTLTLRNPRRSSVDWNIGLSPSVTCDEVVPDEFQFCPSSGMYTDGFHCRGVARNVNWGLLSFAFSFPFFFPLLLFPSLPFIPLPLLYFLLEAGPLKSSYGVCGNTEWESRAEYQPKSDLVAWASRPLLLCLRYCFTADT